MTKKMCHVLSVAFLVALLAASPAWAQEAAEKSDKGDKTDAQKSTPEKTTGEKSSADKSPPEWLQPTTRPAQLRATSASITLRQEGDSRAIYEAIGKEAGIKVLFDPDYIPRTIRVDINKASLPDALEIVAMQSRTFWRPVNSETIFVAADSAAKRREFEQSIYKTFYLSNVSNPTDLQDVGNALRSIVEIQRLQQIPSLGAMVVRGTPAQITLVQKVLDDLDKARKKFGGEYRLEFRINQLEGEKKLNSRVYTLLLEPHEFGKLRIGTRVPLGSTFIDVGQNIDCQVRTESERMIGLNVDFDFSNFGMTEPASNAGSPATGSPVLQQFRITTKTDLEIGKPTIINSFDDPTSKRTFQIEVTATRVRDKE